MGIKLNIGCGDRFVEGADWHNIDVRKVVPTPGAIFIKHDIRYLRELYDDGCIDEIRASDVIEHFSRAESTRLLADCVALLKIGGRLEIKTPEVGLLIQYSQVHKANPELVAHRWYGNQDYPTNCHLWVWPWQLLCDTLVEMGCKIVSDESCEDTNLHLIVERER